ncbi:MAG: hypothetical protein DPW09_25970 [Anaerolineae bacterium]|nr:hypothetical protein [Anaerolineae bacterium]
MKSPRHFRPFPLIALAMLALLMAMWAGLIRLGWGWPSLRPALPAAHGPLMISGFLGTLIGVERAVALSTSLKTGLDRRWTYIGPLLTSLGALALIIGWPSLLGPLLMTLGSVGLVVVFGLILRLQFAPFTMTMALGAMLWLTGNVLWLTGWPIYSAVLWWAGFLMLTIAGERLELNRVLRLSGYVQRIFLLAVTLFLVGLVITLFNFDLGVRLAGAGMIALALWLLRYDIARYTVRKTGLTRFIAVCLLSGYIWLGLSGLLALRFGGVTAGFQYDALLHTFFVGFVISMIFGHAPIIFPAVLGKSFTFQPVFYSHLVLLHLSLLLRVAGDLIGWLPARQWGGLLNVIALLLFLANTGRAVLRSTD